MGRSIGLGTDAARWESTKCAEKRVKAASGEQVNLSKYGPRRRVRQSSLDKLAVCIQETEACYNGKQRVLAGLNHPSRDFV